jgi:pilus assembly protein CpaF
MGVQKYFRGSDAPGQDDVPADAGETQLIQTVAPPAEPGDTQAIAAVPAPTGKAGASGSLTPIKASIRRQVISEQLQRPQFARLIEEDPAAARQQLTAIIERLMDEHAIGAGDRPGVLAYVLDNIFGFGPIEPLLHDAGVTEIIISGPSRVFVERGGQMSPTDIVFEDDNHLNQIVQVILRPLNRPANESNPIVNGRLPDGSRVNVVMPPLAIDGISVNIRKFSRDKWGASDLVAKGALSEEMATFLSRAVRARMNILVSGGTGSGKTTLLNILSSFIPEDQHVVTIEDAAELQLRHPFIKRLEARPPNLAGQGEVSIRDLVRNALRMRPDRIVVGEVRGDEAIDMLTAMNTGHDGSLSTVHANTARDVISRLETMVLQAKPLPLPAIRKQIASAVQLIVQTQRMADGSRKVIDIAEITGVDANDDVLVESLYAFRADAQMSAGRVTGEFVKAKRDPALAGRISAALYETSG